MHSSLHALHWRLKCQIKKHCWAWICPGQSKARSSFFLTGLHAFTVPMKTPATKTFQTIHAACAVHAASSCRQCTCTAHQAAGEPGLAGPGSTALAALPARQLSPLLAPDQAPLHQPHHPPVRTRASMVHGAAIVTAVFRSRADWMCMLPVASVSPCKMHTTMCSTSCCSET